MRKLALYPVCFIAGLSFAVFPRIADAVVLFWQAVLLAVAVLCVVALCWFTTLFLYRRTVNASSTAQASQDAPEHTQHGYSVPPIEQAVLQARWNASALQLAVISMHKGKSCSSRALFPYILENRRLYWEWFIDETMRLGFVEKRKKRGYFWRGSYKLFSERMQNNTISVLPCPNLPPPTVLWINGVMGTLNTGNTPDTADTVTSYGDSVFIGS